MTTVYPRSLCCRFAGFEEASFGNWGICLVLETRRVWERRGKVRSGAVRSEPHTHYCATSGTPQLNRHLCWMSWDWLCFNDSICIHLVCLIGVTSNTLCHHLISWHLKTIPRWPELNTSSWTDFSQLLCPLKPHLRESNSLFCYLTIAHMCPQGYSALWCLARARDMPKRRDGPGWRERPRCD